MKKVMDIIEPRSVEDFRNLLLQVLVSNWDRRTILCMDRYKRYVYVSVDTLYSLLCLDRVVGIGWFVTIWIHY
jgi:hypothetical protein